MKQTWCFLLVLWLFVSLLVNGDDNVASASFHMVKFNSSSSGTARWGAIGIDDSPTVKCTPQDAEQIVKHFIAVNRDNTNCPREDWLHLMAKADHRNKVLVNIGVNKGYNLAVWMNIFTPWNHITPAIWGKHLCLNGTDIRQCCGVCNDCRAVLDIPMKLPSAHPPHVTMIGVDLNNHNLLQINRVLDRLHGDHSVDTFGVSVFTLHAAISDIDGEIPMINCPPGEETCSMANRSPTGKLAAWTPDKVMENFISEHSNYFHRHHRTHMGNAYNPKVDILMIDVEGYDALALKGSQKLLAAKDVRCLIFEYHNAGPWKEHKIEDTVNMLDGHGYDCYFQGMGRLWQVTGCWDARYEFHQWSNVMCVLRMDVWHQVLQPLVQKAIY